MDESRAPRARRDVAAGRPGATSRQRRRSTGRGWLERRFAIASGIRQVGDAELLGDRRAVAVVAVEELDDGRDRPEDLDALECRRVLGPGR